MMILAKVSIVVTAFQMREKDDCEDVYGDALLQFGQSL